MLCRGEGRERGGIISWIGRPSGIRALLLVFSGTGAQMGGMEGGREDEEAQKQGKQQRDGDWQTKKNVMRLSNSPYVVLRVSPIIFFKFPEQQDKV